MGVLITPMALAHPLHPITNRSRDKRRNLWLGWCVYSWRPWFWSVYSVYHIHTIFSCTLSIQNNLFLIDAYIPKVGVTMMVCCMIGHCCSFLLGFKCTLVANVMESPTRLLHGLIFRHDFEIIRDPSYKSCSRDYFYIFRQQIMWKNAA